MYMRRRFILSIISFYILAVYVYAAPAKISFSADKMHGSGSKGNSSTALTGNAQVSVDSLTIHGERIELYGKDYRYIKAIGTVTGEDPEKEDTKNKVETAAERIEYNQKNEIILLQMAVHLKSKEIVCDSLFAVYNRTSSMLDLTGRPVVKKGKDEFKAARISVDLNTEDIRLEGKVSGSVTEEKESPKKTDIQKADTQKSDTKTPDSKQTDVKAADSKETAVQEASTKKIQEQASAGDKHLPDTAKTDTKVPEKQDGSKNPKSQPAGGAR